MQPPFICVGHPGRPTLTSGDTAKQRATQAPSDIVRMTDSLAMVGRSPHDQGQYESPEYAHQPGLFPLWVYRVSRNRRWLNQSEIGHRMEGREFQVQLLL